MVIKEPEDSKTPTSVIKDPPIEYKPAPIQIVEDKKPEDEIDLELIEKRLDEILGTSKEDDNQIEPTQDDLFNKINEQNEKMGETRGKRK